MAVSPVLGSLSDSRFMQSSGLFIILSAHIQMEFNQYHQKYLYTLTKRSHSA